MHSAPDWRHCWQGPRFALEFSREVGDAGKGIIVLGRGVPGRHLTFLFRQFRQAEKALTAVAVFWSEVPFEKDGRFCFAFVPEDEDETCFGGGGDESLWASYGVDIVSGSTQLNKRSLDGPKDAGSRRRQVVQYLFVKEDICWRDVRRQLLRRQVWDWISWKDHYSLLFSA